MIYYDVIRQILQFALKFVWRHQWRHRLPEKSEISYFIVKTIVSRLSKYLFPIQLNLQNKPEIQISVKHTLQNAVAMTSSDPIT